jgi:hypothetical protein
MKSVPVVALDPVRDDVQAAYDYFEEQLPGGGDAFLSRYFTTADRIGLNPEIFSIKFSDYRRAFVPRSNLGRLLLHRAGARGNRRSDRWARNPRVIRAVVRQRRSPR